MRASRQLVKAVSGAVVTLIGAVAANAAPGPANYYPMATPKQVLSASLDCWRVVGPGGVNRASLKALGWKPRALSAPVAKRLRVLGKEAQGPVIVLADEGAEKKGCIVGATLANPSEASAITKLLVARVGIEDQNRKIHDDGAGLALQTRDKRLVALPNGRRTAISIYIGPEPK